MMFKHSGEEKGKSRPAANPLNSAIYMKYGFVLNSDYLRPKMPVTIY
jgi:hypothetical protein